jgi:putative ABC transport system permease protein
VAKNSTLEQQPLPEIFIPYSQGLLPLSAYFVVRTVGDPSSFGGPIRNAVQMADRNQAVSDIQTLEEVLAQSSAPQRFRMLILAIFAGLALVLAAVGVFGVMASSVNQRQHELGVRLALGATTGDILVLVVGQGMLITAIGLGIGTAGAAVLTRLLSYFLYEVNPTDPATFAVSLVLITGAALLACYVPARRAARVDPLLALRNE